MGSFQVQTVEIHMQYNSVWVSKKYMFVIVSIIGWSKKTQTGKKDNKFMIVVTSEERENRNEKGSNGTSSINLIYNVYFNVLKIWSKYTKG